MFWNRYQKIFRVAIAIVCEIYVLDLFCAIIVNPDDASFLELDKRFSDIQVYSYKVVRGRSLFAFLMSSIDA